MHASQGSNSDEAPVTRRYDDGEVSFSLHPPLVSSTPFPIRRRRGQVSFAASPVVRTPSPELRTPESFAVSSDARGAGVNSSTVGKVIDDRATPPPSSSSTSQKDVQSATSRFERRPATIMLGAFDGSTPVETHLAKLRNCSEFYGWSSTDRVCHLKASLEGSAATILWELPSDCTVDKLLQIIRNRFGDAEQTERYRFMLRTRRRRKGETLQALYQDICRLWALSYPGETGPLSRIVARDAFLDSLADPELRIKVLEKDATSIEQAYTVAARYEAFLSSSEVDSRRPVRVVETCGSEPAEDSSQWRRRLEASIVNLQDRVEALLQRQPVNVTACTPSTVSSAVLPMGVAESAASCMPPSSSSSPVAPLKDATSTSGREMRTTRNRRRLRSDGLCFRCGEHGHIAKNCSKIESKSPATPARVVQTIEFNDDSQVYFDAQLQKGSKLLRVPIVLDTGCSLSVMPAKFSSGASLRPTNVKLVAANGAELSVSGRTTIVFLVEGYKFHADVLVSESIDEILLGQDWLTQNRCNWRFADATVIIAGHEFKLRKRRGLMHSRRVYATDNVKAEGHSVTMVPVKLALPSLRACSSNWLIEPRLVDGRLLVARGLFDDGERAAVQVFNPSDVAVFIKNGYCFGNAERIDFQCKTCGDVCSCVPHDAGRVRTLEAAASSDNCSAADADVNSERIVISSASNAAVITDDNELIKPVLDSLPDCLNDSQRREVESLLLLNANLFARHEYDVGCTSLLKYRVELRDPNETPVCEPLRQHPIAYLDLIDAEVDKLLDAGLIQRCNSTLAANIVLVKRRSLPGIAPRIRVTVDYRSLNSRIRRFAFPTVSTQLVLQSLQGFRYFSVCDCSNAYLSIPLDEETSYLTAFVTRRGMYKWTRLCAGISSGGACFNQLVQNLFSDMLWTEVLAFLDDLTLPSKTIDEGINLLEKVFNRLHHAGLKLKASKCKLLQTKVRILGVMVSEGQISEDPSRAEVIRSMSFPKTVRELRRLIGFVNYGRNFYKNLAEVLSPLTDCLKKGAKIEQNALTVGAFERIKGIMTSPPILQMFDPGAHHALEVDASDTGCGAVLLQTAADGVERIVAYASKCFSEVQRRWCVTRRELFAIIFALRH